MNKGIVGFDDDNLIQVPTLGTPEYGSDSRFKSVRTVGIAVVACDRRVPVIRATSENITDSWRSASACFYIISL